MTKVKETTAKGTKTKMATSVSDDEITAEVHKNAAQTVTNQDDVPSATEHTNGPLSTTKALKFKKAKRKSRINRDSSHDEPLPKKTKTDSDRAPYGTSTINTDDGLGEVYQDEFVTPTTELNEFPREILTGAALNEIPDEEFDEKQLSRD